MAFGSPVSSVVIANTDPLNVSVGNIVPVTGPNGGAVSIAGNVGVTGNVGLVAGTNVNVGNTVPVTGPAGGSVSVAGSVGLNAGASVNVGNAVALAAGTSVNVGNAVALAANTSVNVGNTVPVTGPAGAAVSVSGNVGVTGNVGLVAGTNVNVGNTVPVTGPAGAAVSVSGNVNIGNAVSIVDGASVNVGNAVSLAPNSAINVVNAVNLAAGAQVNVGNKVDVSNSAVDISSLPPDTSKFWPCRSGEDYAPTFSNTSVVYATANGQSVVEVRSGVSNTYASWSALGRYGAVGTTTPTVVTALVWWDGVSKTASFVHLGFDDAAYISFSGTLANLVLQGVADGSVDLAPFAVGWIGFELVFTPTMTRMTVANDTTKRVSLGGVSAANISPRGFLFGNDSGSLSRFGRISNLYVSYPQAVPA